MNSRNQRNRRGVMVARLAGIVGLAGLAASASAQGTSFTYQGQVQDASGPVPSVIDLRFTLFDSATGGTQLGATFCADDVVVDSSGRFTVVVDFGAQYNGTTRHLEIGLRPNAVLPCTNTSGFTLLTPRQGIRRAPQAVYAATAATANTATTALTANSATTATTATTALSANTATTANSANTANTATTATTANNANLFGGLAPGAYRDAAALTGLLPLASLPPEVARRDQANNFFSPSNTFVGNGAGLTNLSAGALTGSLAPGVTLPGYVARRDADNTFFGSLNNFTSAFVGINRDTPISSTERFGIGNQPGIGGQVGMYVRTDQATGIPYYGYSTPGATALSRLTNAGEYELFINGTKRFSVGSGGQTAIALNQTDVVAALSITGLAPQTTELSIRNNISNPWVFGADGPSGPSGNGKFTVRNSTSGPALTTFDTNGNVGINDTTPQSKLTIGGTDQWAPGVGSGFGDFTISNASGTNALSMGVSTSGAGAGTARLWTRGTASMVLGTGSGAGQELLWINGNGTVGVGTGLANSLAPLYFPSTVGNKIALHGANNIDQFGLGIANFAMRLYVPTSSDIFAFGSGNASTFGEWMRIGNGRIGVGETNLLRSVNVRGGVAIDTFGENNGVNSLANGLTFGFGTSGEGIASRRTVGTGQFGLQFYTASTERMTILNNGSVGIGTSVPGDRFAVRNGAIAFHSPANDIPYVGFDFDSVTDALRLRANVSGATLNTTWMTISRVDGNVGIGVTNPAAKLDVGGLARVHAIDITGGSDLSEGFEVSAAQNTEPVAGHVVVMDPSKPGQLMVASEPYDSRVVGVISGANGVKTGMMMRQEGSIASGSQPVALTGRVYVMVDASQSPIAVGDLLTTSSTPGHAMKATDPTRAYGAVIGKAMEPMPEGRGMVLVLINLH